MAEARLARDGFAILRYAHCARPFPLAATRAAADAIRFSPENESIRQCATRLIVAAQRRWDGAPMWWMNDIDGLPTERQIDIGSRIIDGADADTVATELHLSKRTVENHLYRFMRSVGVNSTEDLRDVMAEVEYTHHRA